MRIFTWIFSLLTILALSACSKSCVIPKQLSHAENLMLTRPDSAISLLSSINFRQINNRKQKAKYALLYSQALDKNYIDVDKDTLIRIARNYYAHNGTANDKALAYYYSGRIFENRHSIDTALLQYLKAEEYVKKTDNTYLKALLANAIGLIYQIQLFRNLSKEKFLESADLFQRIGYNLNAAKSLMGAADACMVLKEYSHAIRYQNEAEEQIKDLNAPSLGLAIALSRAKIYIDQLSDPKSALSMLHSAYDKYTSGIAPKSHYFTLGDIYLKLNQVDSAFFYIEPLLSDIYLRAPRTQAETYYLAGRILEKKAQHSQAYEYNNKALKIIDSLYFADKDQSIYNLQERYHSDQLTLRNLYLRKLTKYQFIVAVLLLIGLLSVSLWLINRRHKKIMLQEEQLAEYKTTILNLNEEYKQLQSIQENFNDKSADDYLKRILGKRLSFLQNILELTITYSYDKELHFSKMKQLLANDNKQEVSVLVIFRDMVDAKEPGVLNFLLGKYPDLSEQDIDLYCLTCLDISVPATSLVLGLSPKTVYNRRNNIRKKMSISNESIGFKDHFQSLCIELHEIKNSDKTSH